MTHVSEIGLWGEIRTQVFFSLSWFIFLLRWNSRNRKAILFLSEHFTSVQDNLTGTQAPSSSSTRTLPSPTTDPCVPSATAPHPPLPALGCHQPVLRFCAPTSPGYLIWMGSCRRWPLCLMAFTGPFTEPIVFEVHLYDSTCQSYFSSPYGGMCLKTNADAMHECLPNFMDHVPPVAC